ncbi:MAG TPA: hypothetical protein VEA38_04130 [Terriglobales bacterium]|nr:hypothetical protein [Terriglobales bacterium]
MTTPFWAEPGADALRRHLMPEASPIAELEREMRERVLGDRGSKEIVQPEGLDEAGWLAWLVEETRKGVAEGYTAMHYRDRGATVRLTFKRGKRP